MFIAGSHAFGVIGTVKSTAQKGGVATLGGLDVYTSQQNRYPSSSIIIFTDLFGWKFNNTRVWADRRAEDTGAVVVIPDFFHGQTLPADRSKLMAWLGQFPPAKVIGEYGKVVEDIKKRYPTVKKFAVEGFCWGGLYATLLSAGNPAPISAAISYHGSLLTEKNVAAVTGPISYQNADPKLDTQVGPQLYDALKKILDEKRAKGQDASITYYPGMAHGFALRGDSNNATVSKQQEAAYQAGVKFFKKYL